jgi:hypothetical protein
MNRRTFIHAAGATGVGLGGLCLAAPTDAITTLAGSLADWPRERVPAELARRVQAGLRHEDLLAALSLAATCSVQPYPVVGFKYHAVMVLRAIHAATQHLSSVESWLPLVWAADYVKDAQAEEKAESGWHMSARSAPAEVDPLAARRALVAALDRWDREAADAAVVACAARAQPGELLPLLLPYGARDLRDIGHKAITVSNAHTLVTLFGAGPVSEAILRSTVAALLNSDGERDPASSDLAPDRPWRVNRERLSRIPRTWKAGGADPGAQAELRAGLYRASAEDAGGLVAGMLQRGLSPQAIWQVLFDVAAELVVHSPNIVAVHAQTTANALHHAFRVSEDEQTQQLALLQAAAFIAMFRGMVRATEKDVDLGRLEPLTGTGADPLEEIFADLAAGHRRQAMRKSLGFLTRGGDADRLISQARHHVIRGAEEPHDYKLAEAVFDTAGQFPDPLWRSRYLAAGMAYFKAPAPHPVPVVEQTLRLLSAGH